MKINVQLFVHSNKYRILINIKIISNKNSDTK